MSSLAKLRHTHTKTLRAFVGWVRRQQQRNRYVPAWLQFAAAAAQTIIELRKETKR